MIPILRVIAPLFIIIFASAVLKRCKLIPDDWSEVLNDFSLKIGLPVLVFTALTQSNFSLTSQAELVLVNSVFIIFTFLLALIIAKSLNLSHQVSQTIFISLGFSNIAYLGIPILSQTFGPAILPVASLIVAIYLFWFFSLGIGYLDYTTAQNTHKLAKTTLQQLTKNPILIAVALALIIKVLAIPMPAVILESLQMISASVTPTVLIVIGLFIGQSQLGQPREWLPVLLFSLMTLIILPALFYFGLYLFDLDQGQFASSIIQTAMPLAITPFALADKYNLNKTFISRAIVLSTLLSMVTIPFWIGILKT